MTIFMDSFPWLRRHKALLAFLMCLPPFGAGVILCSNVSSVCPFLFLTVSLSHHLYLSLTEFKNKENSKITQNWTYPIDSCSLNLFVNVEWDVRYVLTRYIFIRLDFTCKWHSGMCFHLICLWYEHIQIFTTLNIGPNAANCGNTYKRNFRTACKNSLGVMSYLHWT